MHHEEQLVKLELNHIIHDGAKVEAGIKMVESLFAKDKDMKQFWLRLATNVMAKDFIAGKVKEEEKLKAFKTDVAMQEFSKGLSLAYNGFEPPPPKQIDMLHVGLVELIQMDEKPFYAFESFIAGKYHKWNTNAGWLDSRSRHTPQAFSFFSYRFTNGHYMVVDIQGKIAVTAFNMHTPHTLRLLFITLRSQLHLPHLMFHSLDFKLLSFLPWCCLPTLLLSCNPLIAIPLFHPPHSSLLLTFSLLLSRIPSHLTLPFSYGYTFHNPFSLAPSLFRNHAYRFQ